MLVIAKAGVTVIMFHFILLLCGLCGPLHSELPVRRKGIANKPVSDRCGGTGNYWDFLSFRNHLSQFDFDP